MVLLCLHADDISAWPLRRTVGPTDLEPTSVGPLWLGNDSWLGANGSANATLVVDDADVYCMAAISVLLGIMILITIIGKPWHTRPQSVRWARKWRKRPRGPRGSRGGRQRPGCAGTRMGGGR